MYQLFPSEAKADVLSLVNVWILVSKIFGVLFVYEHQHKLGEKQFIVVITYATTRSDLFYHFKCNSKYIKSTFDSLVNIKIFIIGKLSCIRGIITFRNAARAHHEVFYPLQTT